LVTQPKIQAVDSCRVGQCESCLVPIKQGQVCHLVDCPDLEDGQCVTCQAVPLTDLVLDA
jgi:ferredoxin